MNQTNTEFVEIWRKKIKKPIKKCSYCGNEFEIEINKKYIVKSQDSLISCSYFDAMDCPICGCQNIIWKRIEKVSENTKETKK